MEIKLGIISQKSKEEIKLENALNFAEGKQKQARAETEISVNGKKITSGPIYDAAKAKLKIAGQNYKTAKAAYDAFITKKNEPKETEQTSEAERKAELDAAALGETYVPGSANSGFKGGAVGSGSTLSGSSISGGFTGIAPNDIAKDIYAMSDADRKVLAQNLKNAGYKVKVTGVYNDDLVAEYQSALSENQTRNITLGLKQGIEEFLTAKTIETTALGLGTGTVPTTSISPKADATVYINAALKEVGINRDATPQEIDSLYKVLNDAENRFKTTKVGGVTKDLLGNRTQFIANLITTGKYVDPNTGKPIKGLDTKKFKDVKEAAKILGTLSKSATAIKADTRSLSVGTIKSTANANGISLSPQQLDQYALDVQNGKDIKVIQNEIRSIAGAGMPENIKKLLSGGTNLDVVYAPYKTQMAAILEVNPETINFTDPALRGAIGPTGEMSIYDFQKALRKDARWQYTNNAREDVFQSVSKVLQDFGFQG